MKSGIVIHTINISYQYSFFSHFSPLLLYETFQCSFGQSKSVFGNCHIRHKFDSGEINELMEAEIIMMKSYRVWKTQQDSPFF